MSGGQPAGPRLAAGGRPSERAARGRRASGQRGDRARRRSATGSHVSPSAGEMSSAVAPGRRRRMATMMPRPTTTSAAATTSTKNTDTWPADVVERSGEGHEGEVDGVEHQLDAHEHHQRVAPDQQADGADGEQDGAEHEVPGVGRRSSRLHLRLGVGLGAGRLRPPGQDDRADHGDDEQQPRDLEGEHVVGEEDPAQHLDVGLVAAERRSVTDRAPVISAARTASRTMQRRGRPAPTTRRGRALPAERARPRGPRPCRRRAA